MARLSKRLIQEIGSLPTGLSGGLLASHPEKILQFGEGKFLRAFSDWMVDVVNEAGLFNGRVVLVQPRHEDRVGELNAQDCCYTVLLRGVRHGAPFESRRIVTSVSRALGARSQWEALVECFRRPGLRYVISNTTEAGIVYAPEACRLGVCPESFPAKVTALLYQRFLAARADPSWGLVFLPCELIQQNGETLRRFVLQHAEAWGLGRVFTEWITRSHYFLNTLVDRIVTGIADGEADRLQAELGYEDHLLVAGEPYHLWVIEGPISLAEEIPFHRAGLNVVWVDDVEPYRERKVRLLNGAHTASALAGFLAGIDMVSELMADPFFGPWVQRMLLREILPTVPLPTPRTTKYARLVLDRLRNPFVRHELLSISLNSVSKWRVRVLPTLLDFQRLRGVLPPALSFSLAALIMFYRGTRLKPGELTGRRSEGAYPVRDEPAVLDFFEACWSRFEAPEQSRQLASAILGHAWFWGADLTSVPGLTDRVTEALVLIRREGVRTALETWPRS